MTGQEPEWRNLLKLYLINEMGKNRSITWVHIGSEGEPIIFQAFGSLDFVGGDFIICVELEDRGNIGHWLKQTVLLYRRLSVRAIKQKGTDWDLLSVLSLKDCMRESDARGCQLYKRFQ